MIVVNIQVRVRTCTRTSIVRFKNTTTVRVQQHLNWCYCTTDALEFRDPASHSKIIGAPLTFDLIGTPAKLGPNYGNRGPHHPVPERGAHSRIA